MTIPDISEMFSTINLNDFTIDVPFDIPNTVPHTLIENINRVEISEEIIAKGSDVVCRRCGRPLKDYNSRLLGMGPTCYKLYIKERTKQTNLLCRKNLGNNGNNNE